MLASTTTSLFTIITTMALLINESTALPTRRSTAGLSRRNNQRRAVAAPFELSKRQNMGDHSIVVDASSSSSPFRPQGAGIKNSTINLTVISRRSSPSSSTFARLTRALFGRSPSPIASPTTSSSSAPIERKPLGVHIHSQALKRGARGHGAIASSQAKVQAQAVKAKREGRKPAAGARKVERQLMVTDMAEQESVYRAAVAALAEHQSTSTTTKFETIQPVIKAAIAPSPIESGTTITTITTELEPITLTVTLVGNPSSPSSQYINAAALSSSSLAAAAPSRAARRIPLPPTSASMMSSEQALTTGAPSSFRKARRSPAQLHARKVHQHAQVVDHSWRDWTPSSSSA